MQAQKRSLCALSVARNMVRGGVFPHHAPTKMCENSTAFELSLDRARTRMAVRALLLVLHVFACLCMQTRFDDIPQNGTKPGSRVGSGFYETGTSSSTISSTVSSISVP